MTSNNSTTLVRATKATAKRLDRLAPKLEKEKGGSWSRAHVIDAALDALEEKLSTSTESPATPQG